MKTLVIFIFMSIFLSVPSVDAQQNDQSHDDIGSVIYLDIDARNDTYWQSQYVYLTAGTYKVKPIGIAQGGKFNARNSDGNAVSGCDEQGGNCQQGWDTRVAAAAYNIDKEPIEMFNNRYWANQFWCVNENAMAAGKSYRFKTPELAITAAQEVGAFDTCEFTLDQDAYVQFFDQDTLWSDNVKGVSYTLTKVQTYAQFLEQLANPNSLVSQQNKHVEKTKTAETFYL